jgi:hypothetical protein
MPYAAICIKTTIAVMKRHRTYLIELFAIGVGIIYSPVVFYYYLLHKLSLATEQIEFFGIAYSEALQKPKTAGVRFADHTAQALMLVLFALGFVTGNIAFHGFAATIGFTLVVEWLWRREASDSSTL